MTRGKGRTRGLRWVLGLMLAAGLVYVAYFTLLLVVDSELGTAQLQSDWLFESRRGVMSMLLRIVAESAAIVWPVTLAAVLATVVRPSGAVNAAVRAFVVCALIGVVAAWLGLSPVAATISAVAVGIAALSAWAVIRSGGYARA